MWADSYTDTGGTGGGWADVISAGLNAWASTEREKEITERTQAQSFAQTWQFQDAQAKANSYTKTGNQSQMMTTMLMLGGVAIAGLLVWKLAK